ncbi:hypothetical protein LTR36_010527 [Oleoguttula mirabilis]|uniref:ribonuclease H n=1 Tax=Oleoguttula mirabilis TaxID=1507867 RepID=A0AAV9J4M9_9PEZI|nr:hypothetical protein LTR36_010527 [Oleoguttula mirabilis]
MATTQTFRLPDPQTGLFPNVRLGRDISNYGGVFGYLPGASPESRPPIYGAPFTRAPYFERPSPTDTPRDLFIHDASEDTRGDLCHPEAHRLVRRTNDRERLVYVDGSCLDQNDSTNAVIRRAGCGFVFRPAPYAVKDRVESFRLEAKGPTGVESPQTSNRAELRAAIGALQFRRWDGEGSDRLVIATDSEYVVLGITHRIEDWVARRWRTSAGKAIKNKDLWECLLAEVNKFAQQGMEVVFWRIPREWNDEADAAAKEAARTLEPKAEFVTLSGVLV